MNDSIKRGICNMDKYNLSLMPQMQSDSINKAFAKFEFCEFLVKINL
jgi:hypothetical protein